VKKLSKPSLTKRQHDVMVILATEGTDPAEVMRHLRISRLNFTQQIYALGSVLGLEPDGSSRSLTRRIQAEALRRGYDKAGLSNELGVDWDGTLLEPFVPCEPVHPLVYPDTAASKSVYEVLWGEDK
jgi:hypothetical protein